MLLFRIPNVLKVKILIIYLLLYKFNITKKVQSTVVFIPGGLNPLVVLVQYFLWENTVIGIGIRYLNAYNSPHNPAPQSPATLTCLVAKRFTLMIFFDEFEID